MRHLLRLKCTQNAQDACIRTLSNARNHQVSDASATLAKLHAQRHVGRSSRRHVRTIARLTMTYVSKAFTTLKELHARRYVGCISEESSNTTTKSMQFTQTRILLDVLLDSLILECVLWNKICTPALLYLLASIL